MPTRYDIKVITKTPYVSKKTLASAKPYRAAILHGFNQNLTIEPITNRIKLRDGMVRVGVWYCSLNVNDVKSMENKNEDIILPMVPGNEFSGVILEMAESCKRNFKVGQKVSTLLAYQSMGGGLAEECVVSEDECFPVSSVSLRNAAVLPQGYGTALLAFTKFYELQEGDDVIIIAGSAGFGLAAIKLASSVFKAKVYAICDTEDTSALLRQEGAFASISVNEGLPNVYQFLVRYFKDKKAKLAYDSAGVGLFHVVNEFMHPDGHFITTNLFHSLEKLELAKTDTDNALVKLRKHKSSADFISKIQHVDLSELRTTNFSLYRQIVMDTFILCEEKIILPCITCNFKLDEVNTAIDMIKRKKCTGRILIDTRST